MLQIYDKIGVISQNLFNKGAFQVKRNDKRNHSKIKQNLRKRLEHRPCKRDIPMLTADTIHYEISGRTQGIHCGGIGSVHMMARQSGLVRGIDRDLQLLKQHQPYHESDHILNMAYNILAGGSSIEDIEVRREDPGYMQALGAQRIPDPTTARDFLMRFKKRDVQQLMGTINRVRQQIWRAQSASFRKRAMLNIDSTIAETTGKCKRGMDIAYNGLWGYGPLIVSLANTREPLYIENRPGNTYSSVNGPTWIDKSIKLVKDIFDEVWIGGDTAFSMTKSLDRWDEEGVNFVLGYTARPSLVGHAEELTGWERLKRPVQHQIKTKPRRHRHNIKERISKRRGYKTEHLVQEQVTEYEYCPNKCKKTYRMIVLKKKIKVTKGQLELFDQVRYFFYITNNRTVSASEAVYMSNDRCDHENDIDQLKNGVHALRMPGHDLISNWAYTVIASLAWTLKSWMGLLMPHRATGKKIIRMEFKRFLNTFINIPAQIISKAGQIWYRLIGYMKCAPAFFSFVERCQCLKLPDG